MLARWRAAGLLWPTLLSVAALAVLLGLGTWQLQRKAWKESLIAAITARTRAEPRPLDGHVLLIAGPVGAEYLRVRATGSFVHGQERHVFMPGREGPGWLVVTPLVREDGPLVLVNRGWVPDALRDPAKRPAGQLRGKVDVVGLLRAAERPGWFQAVNDPRANAWYWRDVAAMWRCRPGTEASQDCRRLSMPPELKHLPAALPFVLDAEPTPANPGGWPRGGATNLSIPNRHLEYAVTWYGLAATLLGVFAAFARGRLRAPQPSP